MKPDAYQRNLAARAFDVARYTLFFGIPTGVGQVTSIRTLERQIRRLKASAYAEIRDLAEEIAAACAQPPACAWDEKTAAEPLARPRSRATSIPTSTRSNRASDLEAWARENISIPPSAVDAIDLLRPTHTHAEIAATLLYPVTDLPFRDLYELACSWSPGPAQRSDRRGAPLPHAPRRTPARLPRRPVRLRHRHGHRGLSRYAPPPPLPAVPSGVFGPPRLRHAAGADRRRHRGLLCHSDVGNAGHDSDPPRTRRALPAALRRPLALPVQDGLRPNTSRASAAASKATSATARSPGR